jgi:hypothetical protein
MTERRRLCKLLSRSYDLSDGARCLAFLAPASRFFRLALSCELINAGTQLSSALSSTSCLDNCGCMGLALGTHTTTVDGYLIFDGARNSFTFFHVSFFLLVSPQEQRIRESPSLASLFTGGAAVRKKRFEHQAAIEGRGGRRKEE